ncbi:MAG: hypothetical protein IPJ66_20805 [Bacteroidetes bacterium]|nr:hypothetical protein [Bacteroidota bacterium]
MPLLDKGSAASMRTVTTEEIRPAPTRSISSIASRVSGVEVTEGEEIETTRGKRSDATAVYVDGVKSVAHFLGLRDRLSPLQMYLSRNWKETDRRTNQ